MQRQLFGKFCFCWFRKTNCQGNLNYPVGIAQLDGSAAMQVEMASSKSS